MTSCPWLRRSRASLLLATALFGTQAACGDGPVPPPPAASERVQAVAAKELGTEEFSGFCDVYSEPGKGALLAMPATDRPASDASGTPHWLNVWATWCKPCVEEMPMISRWKAQLAEQGTQLALDFVSVDADDAAVVSFSKEHPGTPATLRLAQADALAGFIQSLGLDSGAGLPIHAFAAADGKLRCVRSGAVTESHFEIIKALLR